MDQEDGNQSEILILTNETNESDAIKEVNISNEVCENIKDLTPTATSTNLVASSLDDPQNYSTKIVLNASDFNSVTESSVVLENIDSNREVIVHGDTEAVKSFNEADSVYLVKWVSFAGKLRPIVTQNDNGPCPLIAIVNVLLLSGELNLLSAAELVTSSNLMNLLSSRLFEVVPRLPAEDRANVEANLAAAFDIFHKLQTGLDMNVRFAGCDQFEFTSEISVFDVFRVALVHGWLPPPVETSCDPQEKEFLSFIKESSYNQLVEFVINGRDSGNLIQEHRALQVEQFLENSCNQLTEYGLFELNRHVHEGQLAIFFRNNHFSTIYKHKNALYLLATDHGWLNQPHIVWETIAIEGNSYFVDGEFVPYEQIVYDNLSGGQPTSHYSSNEAQMHADMLLAICLSHESGLSEWVPPTDSDEQLARQLQAQEDSALTSANNVSESELREQPRSHNSNASQINNRRRDETVPPQSRANSSCSSSGGNKEKECHLL